MYTTFIILFIVIGLASLIGGLGFIFDWWTVKDENGDKKPLSKKDKWVVAILTVTGIIGILSFFFSTKSPVKAWLDKRANNKATAPAR